MNLQEIKQTIEDGEYRVHWSNDSYEVIKDSKGQYLIKHASGSCIGLDTMDGKLNGKENDFYVNLICKPCPNCGETNNIQEGKGNTLKCFECGTQGPEAKSPRFDSCMEAWNRISRKSENLKFTLKEGV